jgi:hypothetical protein
MSTGGRTFGGVLPYAHDAAGGVHILLGRERWGREAGAWSGFAGKCEACDRGDPVRTAAREAFEEACGLLGSVEDLLTILPARATRFAAPNGTHYLLPFQLNGFLPVQFAGAQAAVRAAAGSSRAAGRFLEKDAVAWFALADLQTNDGGTAAGEHDGTVAGGRDETVAAAARIRLRGGFRADLGAIADAITGAISVKTQQSAAAGSEAPLVLPLTHHAPQ